MLRLLLIGLLSMIPISMSQCTILSLSGGGAFGAVEAGMLDGLVSDYKVPSQFDVITGISAGGLNAAFLHHFEDIPSALPTLKDLYATTKTADIYESDILGIWSRWSIYNNAPLEKTLIRVLGSTNQTSNPPTVLIGASNVDTEELDVFSFGNLTFEEKIDVLMSTTAIPIIFPPRLFQNHYYVDGGVISNELIYQAIGEVDCSYYNITFLNARPKNTNKPKIDGFVSYLSAIVQLILDTFDDQLAQLSSCRFPIGEIHACYPTSPELQNYSMLNFDNGLELYQLGFSNQECFMYPLC